MEDISGGPVAAELDEVDEVLRGLVDDLDEGFAGLVHAYQQVVYSVALRATGRPADAEDLAAEAFLRAYRALLGYSRERIRSLRPRAWLVTIVLNTWRNTVRDASRRPADVAVAEPPEQPSSGPSVEQLAERGELRAELGELVGQLPENQRIAVTLRHTVGMSTSEVAAAMGVPKGTAKSHASRGLSRLRALWTAAPTGAQPPAHPTVTSTGRELR